MVRHRVCVAVVKLGRRRCLDMLLARAAAALYGAVAPVERPSAGATTGVVRDRFMETCERAQRVLAAAGVDVAARSPIVATCGMRVLAADDTTRWKKATTRLACISVAFGGGELAVTGDDDGALGTAMLHQRQCSATAALPPRSWWSSLTAMCSRAPPRFRTMLAWCAGPTAGGGLAHGGQGQQAVGGPAVAAAAAAGQLGLLAAAA